MSKLAETLRMNESELVGLAKNGCNEAFAKLVRLHQSDLRGFLVRRTGNLAIADDLAQEVFLAAIKQIGSLGDNRRFRSWLFTVARNKLVDHLRSLSREKTSNQIEQLIAQENVARTEQEHALDNDLLTTTLQDCISKLGADAIALIESFYFQNNSAEQIASANNKKSNSIRMALLRIRKGLAVCIRRKLGSEFEL